MKKPNLLVWIILGGILKIYALIIGLRITKKETIKGPAIVISNHSSFSDYIYTTSTVYPHRVSYLAGSKMFYEPIRGPFLRLARAIPKAMFQSDFLAIKKAFEILKKKGIVGIYPEGQLSYHGTSLRPPFGISKLLKKARVPVYVVLIKNAYLRNPPWTEKTFHGKVYSSLIKLFDPEDIDALSEKELFQKVSEAIYFNAGDYNRQHRLQYRVQPIQGLEPLLYACPECHAEGIQAEGHTLVCPQCHHRLVYDHHGFLNGKSIYEWFEQQRLSLEATLQNNADYVLQEHVQLIRYHHHQLKPVGEGILTLSKDAYVYEGLDRGEAKRYEFLTKVVEYLPADIGQNVQIYQDGEMYMFKVRRPFMSTKFFIAGEYYYRRANLR